MVSQHEHHFTSRPANAARPAHATHIWPELVQPAPPMTDSFRAARAGIPIHSAPNRFAHMMEENSPEMQCIFQISEMNLQRQEAERNGNSRSHQPRTPHRYFTDNNGGEPFSVGNYTGHRHTMNRPVDHTAEQAQRMANLLAEGIQPNRFTSGCAEERFWNPISGAYSNTPDGPPVSYGERMPMNAYRPPEPTRIRTDAPMANIVYRNTFPVQEPNGGRAGTFY